MDAPKRWYIASVVGNTISGAKRSELTRITFRGSWRMARSKALAGPVGVRRSATVVNPRRSMCSGQPPVPAHRESRTGCCAYRQPASVGTPHGGDVRDSCTARPETVRRYAAARRTSSAGLLDSEIAPRAVGTHTPWLDVTGAQVPAVEQSRHSAPQR